MLSELATPGQRADALMASSFWPVTNREVIQLYAFATPNGKKITVALEEMEIAYESHDVNIFAGDQMREEYLGANPNGKIPVLIDPNVPGPEPIVMMESCAILTYLAEKSGQFLPADPLARSECLQWLFFQAAHIGPMLGQLSHFVVVAKDKCEHPYPKERYQNEAARLFGVVNDRLAQREYMVGAEYSIADMAVLPWMSEFLEYADILGVPGPEQNPNIAAWMQRCKQRPATARGMDVLKFPEGLEI